MPTVSRDVVHHGKYAVIYLSPILIEILQQVTIPMHYIHRRKSLKKDQFQLNDLIQQYKCPINSLFDMLINCDRL